MMQNDDVIRFYIDYNAVSALAGAQVDGYVSCSLTFSYGTPVLRRIQV